MEDTKDREDEEEERKRKEEMRWFPQLLLSRPRSLPGGKTAASDSLAAPRPLDTGPIADTLIC